MPLRAAAEELAWRVECVVKMEVSTPALARVNLIHRLIDWLEASFMGFLNVRKREVGGSELTF